MILIIHLELRLKYGFVSFRDIVTHEKKHQKIKRLSGSCISILHEQEMIIIIQLEHNT